MRKNLLTLPVIFPFRLWFVGLVCFSLFLHTIYSFNYEADTTAVRAILDSNGLANIPVNVASGLVDGRIYKLELFNYSPFKGTSDKIDNLTYEIGKLTELKMLGLSGNNLTSVPSEIGNLSNLTNLSLYNNSLTELPSEIGNLSSLQYLWVQKNNLRSIPSAIGDLKALQYLYLYDNVLNGLPPQIGNLSGLKELYIILNFLQAVISS